MNIKRKVDRLKWDARRFRQKGRYGSGEKKTKKLSEQKKTHNKIGRRKLWRQRNARNRNSLNGYRKF